MILAVCEGIMDKHRPTTTTTHTHTPWIEYQNQNLLKSIFNITNVGFTFENYLYIFKNYKEKM